MTTPAPVPQAFFTERLMAQRRASSHTITGYRDTLRLLAGFACAKTGKTPSALDIADLDAPLAAAFPDHLEADRHNTVRTRNWRLAAIHSLSGYAALHHPERAAVIQPVLAIAARRHERTLLTRLTAPEADALPAAPDRGTRTGRRDHAMLVLAVQTGLRNSELIGLSHGDVVLDAGAHVRCMGKGRKERATPLTGLTAAVPRARLTENPGQVHDPLFPARTRTRLSHDAIEHRLAAHLATARASCPSLRTKHAAMHTLRHTRAMRLPHAGIDVAVITLWPGHEQIATASICLHADMEEKDRATARATPPDTAPGRCQPPGPPLAFPRQPLIVPACRQSIPPPRTPIRAQIGTITTSDQSAI
jgi:integrase/recombinase XerD